jgi:hypothetical protein
VNSEKGESQFVWIGQWAPASDSRVLQPRLWSIIQDQERNCSGHFSDESQPSKSAQSQDWLWFLMIKSCRLSEREVMHGLLQEWVVNSLWVSSFCRASRQPKTIQQHQNACLHSGSNETFVEQTVLVTKVGSANCRFQFTSWIECNWMMIRNRLKYLWTFFVYKGNEVFIFGRSDVTTFCDTAKAVKHKWPRLHETVWPAGIDPRPSSILGSNLSRMLRL